MFWIHTHTHTHTTRIILLIQKTYFKIIIEGNRNIFYKPLNGLENIGKT